MMAIYIAKSRCPQAASVCDASQFGRSHTKFIGIFLFCLIGLSKVLIKWRKTDSLPHRYSKQGDKIRFRYSWRMILALAIASTAVLSAGVCLGNAGTGMANKPRLLSENCSSYVLSGLAEWLRDNGTKYVPCAPDHPGHKERLSVGIKP